MTNEKYEMVNHPQHYNSTSIETIEKMRRIWGNEKVALWCEMTAFKYRDRIGNKPENPIEQEIGKIKWYEEKAKSLRDLDQVEGGGKVEDKNSDDDNEVVYDMNGKEIHNGDNVIWIDPSTEECHKYRVYEEPTSSMVKLASEYGECEAYPEDCIVIKW